MFVGIVLLVLVIDTFPAPGSIFEPRAITAILDQVGFGHGAWSMYSPDPAMKIDQLSAELTFTDGGVETWDSPNWQEVGSWEKFREFRLINYCNRQLVGSSAAQDDLANYLARTVTHRTSRSSPTTATALELKLLKNERRILPPEDGAFPDSEETYWMSSSMTIRQWSFEP